MRIRLPIVLVLLAWAGSAAAEVTGFKVTEEKTVTVGGRPVRHLKGVVSGRAEANEPDIPTLADIVGLRYESAFELWIPADNPNGRLWISILNRGGDPTAGQRTAVLARGGCYGWCAWQAVNVAEARPRLKLVAAAGKPPAAYGLVVLREFAAHLRFAKGDADRPNPAAGLVKTAFAIGHSQSGRFLRTWILHGLNADKRGKVFDGLLIDGGRAGYIDLFRPDADPGSGGTFSPQTVYPPYAWSELMKRPTIDPKVFALNAESEYFLMMAYLTHRGPVPDNVRVYDFPLGGHGGGGSVGWGAAVRPLMAALEDWAADGAAPPDSRMFTMEKRESPAAKHMADVPLELPALDELGIAKGGVRMPPVAVPVVKFAPFDGKEWKSEPLDKAELARRYGTPEEYRKKVAEVAERLVKDRFLSAADRDKYVAAAEKVTW